MADNLPPLSADVTESGSLNLPEPSGPHRPVMGLLYLYLFSSYLNDVHPAVGDNHWLRGTQSSTPMQYVFKLIKRGWFYLAKYMLLYQWLLHSVAASVVQRLACWPLVPKIAGLLPTEAV
jgi:3',5'-cyclic AMP phosphodiesterase CpdA